VAIRVQAQVSQEASYGDSTAGDSAVTTRPAAAASAVRGGAADRWMRFARPMFGAGIAAGVAAASILWLRSQESPEILAANPIPQTITLAPPDTTSTVAVDNAAAIERVSNGEPERYTTPGPANSISVAPPARLANYVVAHSEYSSPLTRRMALLGLVASDGTGVPTEDAAPEPEAGSQNNAH
ncbi:MAG TPA: hypothetical protein VFZ95_04930, partial [Steroidobacteraceae bacterium]